MSIDKNINKKAGNTDKKIQQKPDAATNDQDINQEAHVEAQKDIDLDADLGIHSPNDDLDEGETARLGEDKTDLV